MAKGWGLLVPAASVRGEQSPAITFTWVTRCPPHTPARPFSLLHFLLPAPAQTLWNKQSLSPSAHGSFLGLSNPALVKCLWTGSLQAISHTLSFLLRHSIRLRNAAKIPKCGGAAGLFGQVRCSPLRMAQQAGWFKAQGLVPLWTNPTLPQHTTGSSSISVSLLSLCLLLFHLLRLLPPQGFTI